MDTLETYICNRHRAGVLNRLSFTCVHPSSVQYPACKNPGVELRAPMSIV